ncbi:hypothetical protein R8Z50_23935 [Longispora sp. K20-0274]|uniref:hypothetical protein n=1 Tax=Longispora sp. K20-0274 TaxID=3088255 RepID=UPI0039999FAA
MTVTFVELTAHREADGWIVGRAPAGPFVALPDVGMETIELLAAGRSTAEVHAELHRRHGEEVDVAAFVASLDRIGFIAHIDGRPGTTVAQPRPSLPWLRSGHLRWLVRWPAAVVWCAAILAAVVLLVRSPERRPGLADLVWADSAALVLLVDAVVASVVISLHELGHLAVARAFGVPGTVTLSTRLTVLVAQTDVTGAWALPRRRRVLVYLAGTATDLLVAAGCVFAGLGFDAAGSVATCLRAVVLTIGLGALSQWALFLRTDGYFLVQDLSGCRNLYGDAGRLLRHWARRGPDPRPGLPPRERGIVSGYAPFMAVGAVLTVGAFLVVSIPVLVRLLVVAGGDVVRGLSGPHWADLADGVVGLAVLAVFHGTLLWLLARQLLGALRRRRTG